MAAPASPSNLADHERAENRPLPVDDRPRDWLLEARRSWMEAVSRLRDLNAVAATRMEAGDESFAMGLFELSLPTTGARLEIEDRVSARVLSLAKVIRPGDPIPLDGFDPVSIDLGGGRRCVVKPALPIGLYPLGGGMRRVSFT